MEFLGTLFFLIFITFMIMSLIAAQRYGLLPSQSFATAPVYPRYGPPMRRYGPPMGHPMRRYGPQPRPARPGISFNF